MSIVDPAVAAKKSAEDADLDASILAGWDAALGGKTQSADLEATVKETEKRVLKKDAAPPEDDEPKVEASEDDEPHDADTLNAAENAKAEEEEAAARAAAGAKEPEPKPAQDPQTLKRLEQLQRAEQRNKAAALQRMQEIQRREQEFADVAARVKSFDEKKERARFDPVGVLSELIGEMSVEDYDAIAQQFFAMGSAGAKDPRVREKATAAMQSRQTMTAQQKLEKELQALRDEREQERAAVQLDRYKSGLATRAQKAIGDETAVVKAMFAQDPDEARELLYFVANDIYQQTGEEPDVADVVVALEAWQRAEMKKRGIDPDGYFKKTQPQPAGEKKTAVTKSLTNNLTNPKAPKKAVPEDDDELDADIIRALQSGQLD